MKQLGTISELELPTGTHSVEQNNLNLMVANSGELYKKFPSSLRPAVVHLHGEAYKDYSGLIDGISLDESVDEAIRYALLQWKGACTTLSDYRTHGVSLTAGQVESLVALLGARCRLKTRARIRSVVQYPVSVRWGVSYGTLGRLFVSHYEESISYCAGQDYPVELRAIKEAIIAG